MALEYIRNNFIVCGEVIPVRIPKPVPSIQVETRIRPIPEITTLRYATLTKKSWSTVIYYLKYT